MKLLKISIFVPMIAMMLVLPFVTFAQPQQGQGTNPPQQGQGTNPPGGNASNQNSNPPLVTKITNPIKVSDLNGLIKTILEGVIKIGIPIVALAIIYSGFLFVSARGNSEQIQTAKRALLYSVIGAAILLGSWAIAQLISDTVLGL